MGVPVTTGEMGLLPHSPTPAQAPALQTHCAGRGHSAAGDGDGVPGSSLPPSPRSRDAVDLAERVRRWLEDPRRASAEESMADVRHLWTATGESFQGTDVSGPLASSPAPAVSGAACGNTGRASAHRRSPGILKVEAVHCSTAIGCVTSRRAAATSLTFQANTEVPNSDDSQRHAMNNVAETGKRKDSGEHVSEAGSGRTSAGEAWTSLGSPSSGAETGGKEMVRKLILQRNPQARRGSLSETTTGTALTQEEERRRAVRRKRNKEAAQRCRARRTALSVKLCKESQDMECLNTTLKYEVYQLEKERNKLSTALQGHLLHCGLKTGEQSGKPSSTSTSLPPQAQR